MNPRASRADSSAGEAMRPVHRNSLSDEIVEQIIDLISRGVLKPGERLPSEKELCRRFGVGRTTIREALRSLAVMGILDGRVGEGTFVSADNRKYLEKALQWGLVIDRKDVSDLVETRLMLESQTAYTAAAKATEENLQEMAEALEGMQRSLDLPEQYLEHDLRFHLAIARGTQNPILYNLLSMTRGYLQTWISESLSKPSARKMRARAESSVLEHQRILQALRKHNPEDARQAMTDHILSSSLDFQAHVEGKSASRPSSHES
jgi:GntR family transcriptional regulator, transcriptional repressor for pyruvate dehydrogenase complex